MLEYRSIADLNRTIVKNLPKIPRDIDLVVGIPRSGLLAANILALHLNLPLTDVDGLLEGRLLCGGKRASHTEQGLQARKEMKVLVVDDSILTGRQMEQVRKKIRASHPAHEILYAAVYAAPKTREKVDLHFEVVPQPQLFEWMMFHCYWLQHSCVDIDGVLCRDPTKEEDDDGPRYVDFLENVEPIIIPTYPIGWLVTTRLEEYRAQTEEWLAKSGIPYKELVMMDLPSKEARQAAGNCGTFKARVYRRTGAVMFVESSIRQAHEIAGITGRPVFCMDSRQMIYGPPLKRAGVVAKRGLRRLPRRILRLARRSARYVLRGRKLF